MIVKELAEILAKRYPELEVYAALQKAIADGLVTKKNGVYCYDKPKKDNYAGQETD